MDKTELYHPRPQTATECRNAANECLECFNYLNGQGYTATVKLRLEVPGTDGRIWEVILDIRPTDNPILCDMLQSLTESYMVTCHALENGDPVNI